MMRTRMPGDGDQIFAQSQQIAADLIRKQQAVQAKMERQRQRDVAAANGEIIPFTEADMRY